MNGDSFFTNLTTEFISIVVTVTYVNWVFKSHKVKKWEETDRRISRRLEILANSYVTALRTNLGLTLVYLDEESFKIRPSTNLKLLMVAKAVIDPIIYGKILLMDVKNWKLLISHLENILDQIDRIIMFYGSKLNPQKYAIILDIQEELEDIVKEYRALQDIFDKPDPSRDLDKYLKAIIAEKIKRIFKLLTKLEQIK